MACFSRLYYHQYLPLPVYEVPAIRVNTTKSTYTFTSVTILINAGIFPKIVSMIRKYHNHKLQTTPWHREEEPLNHHETPGRQIKQSNQLSLPHQDDCNTKMDIN